MILPIRKLEDANNVKSFLHYRRMCRFLKHEYINLLSKDMRCFDDSICKFEIKFLFTAPSKCNGNKDPLKLKKGKGSCVCVLFSIYVPTYQSKLYWLL
jgi:hypothetical protein